MVGADPHGRSVFFADADQGNKAVVYPLDLILIFLVCIFDELEFFLIHIIARVHAHFFHDAGRNLGGIGREMDVCHNGRLITSFSDLVFDEEQVLRLAFAGSRNADEFGAGFYATDGLLHRGPGIHGIRRGHGLNPDGGITTDHQVAHFYRHGFQAFILRQGMGIKLHDGPYLNNGKINDSEWCLPILIRLVGCMGFVLVHFILHVFFPLNERTQVLLHLLFAQLTLLGFGMIVLLIFGLFFLLVLFILLWFFFLLILFVVVILLFLLFFFFLLFF